MSTPDVIIYKISKIIYKYRPLFFGAEFEAEFEIYSARRSVKITENSPCAYRPGYYRYFMQTDC